MTTSHPVEAADTADAEWCFSAVQDVSRTFALTVDILDSPMDEYICIGYLLCRIADTVEDATHIPPAEQVAILDTYDAVLDPHDDTSIAAFHDAVRPWLPPEEERHADWRVVAEADIVVATFHALPSSVRNEIREPVREMVHGMSAFVERYADDGGIRIQTRDELEEYCYYVAGTVGTLVTNLLTRDDMPDERGRILRQTAGSFGQLLQLVNVSKDVYDDYTEENNVYLPAEWLAAEGISQEEIVDPENRDAAASVVSRTARTARSYLDDAQTYIEAMPLRHGNTLAAWLAPYLLAVGTLREIEAQPENALTGADLKVSREEVFAILAAATAAQRETVETLRQRIAETPFHHSSGSH